VDTEGTMEEEGVDMGTMEEVVMIDTEGTIEEKGLMLEKEREGLVENNLSEDKADMKGKDALDESPSQEKECNLANLPRTTNKEKEGMTYQEAHALETDEYITKIHKQSTGVDDEQIKDKTDLVFKCDRLICLQCGYTAKDKPNLKLHIMRMHSNYLKQFLIKTEGADWTKYWLDKINENVAKSSSPLNGLKLEKENGLNETSANEENIIETCVSEINTEEENNIEGKLLEESSECEKENAIEYKPDAPKANEDNETKYDAKEENILLNGSVKKGEEKEQEPSNTNDSQRVVKKKRCQCDLCDKSYHEESGLRLHKESKHLGIKYKCDQCDYKATTKYSLEYNHKKRMHERLTITCDICDFSALTVSDINKHKRKNHKELLLNCELCSFATLHKNILLSHIQEIHENPGTDLTQKTFLCKLCEAKFYKFSHLNNHEKTKHGEKRFKCKLCDYKGSVSGFLKSHMRNKHESVKYLCDQCDYQANYNFNLYEHRQIKHEGMGIACDQCTFIAKNFKQFKMHKISDHSVPALQCLDCGFKSKSTQMDNLRRHIETHQEYLKSFLIKLQDMPNTVEDANSEKALFTCEICGMKLRTQLGLTCHEGKLHPQYSGERPYSCSVCQKGFATNAQLKSHQSRKGQKRSVACYKP